MWYMLLEPKLRVYPNLLPRHSSSGLVNLRKGSASRWSMGSFVGRVWDEFNDSRLRRRAIEELVSLDDRLLQDIGVDRDRIPETVDALLGRHPDSTHRASSTGQEAVQTGNGFSARIWKSFIKPWVRRRTINELSRLDTHLLRDIGLNRGQIPDAVDAMLDRKPPAPADAAVHVLFEKRGEDRDEYPIRAAA